MSDFNWSWLSQFFNVNDPLVVFDIGTWQGDEAVAFARSLPKSRVYTFEA